MNRTAVQYTTAGSVIESAKSAPFLPELGQPLSMQPRYHARQMNTEQAIQRLREVVRRQHKAISTESTYAFWLGRYMLAIPRYPEELTSEQKLERFLTELARDRDLSASMRIFRGGTEADHAPGSGRNGS